MEGRIGNGRKNKMGRKAWNGRRMTMCNRLRGDSGGFALSSTLRNEMAGATQNGQAQTGPQSLPDFFIIGGIAATSRFSKSSLSASSKGSSTKPGGGFFKTLTTRERGTRRVDKVPSMSKLYTKQASRPLFRTSPIKGRRPSDWQKCIRHPGSTASQSSLDSAPLPSVDRPSCSSKPPSQWLRAGLSNLAVTVDMTSSGCFNTSSGMWSFFRKSMKASLKWLQLCVRTS
mmetsp:Transcript_67797/g.141722  ORF Transcript_67797/g.141722 Transcript_67797/m.141722 type:complete len:229 (+) Transcript_67797:230-916(+)